MFLIQQTYFIDVANTIVLASWNNSIYCFPHAFTVAEIASETTRLGQFPRVFVAARGVQSSPFWSAVVVVILVLGMHISYVA